MVRKKILVVEDTPLAGKMASVIIEDLGFEPVLAMTGEQAIEKFSNYHFDFIFMDIGLPDMSGFAVTAELRALEKQKGIHTPIVALTAHSTDEFKLRAQRVDMDGYLIKPLSKDDAKRMLDSHVKQDANYEHPLQASIRSIPALLFYKDSDDRYVACTDQYARWLGLRSPHQLLGRLDSELDITPAAAAVLGLKPKTQPTDYEIPNVEYFVREFDVDQMSIKGAFIATIDGVKMLSMQQPEGTMLDNPSFLGNISHDLRMPLHVILGSANILDGMEADPVKQEMIQGIIEYGKLMSEYIANILIYMKSEDRSLPLCLTSFDLRQLIGDAVRMIRLVLGNKEVEVNSFVDSRIPYRVVCDKHRLFRVIQNLLGNAAKYTTNGHISLAVDVAGESHDAVDIRFIVEDTGIGIDANQLKYIFDQFHQVDSQCDDKKGIGLGLSIVKSFVQDLSGDINVESEVGSGSRFICTLPMHKSMEQTTNRMVQYDIN